MGRIGGIWFNEQSGNHACMSWRFANEHIKMSAKMLWNRKKEK